MYSLAKKSKISYSTINDLVNGRVAVDNCKVSVLRGLSLALNISMEELYKLLDQDTEVLVPGMKTNADIEIKNKTYYVNFEYDGKQVQERVCKVNKNTTIYAKELAEWTVSDYIEDKEFEKASKKLMDDYIKKQGKGG